MNVFVVSTDVVFSSPFAGNYARPHDCDMLTSVYGKAEAYSPSTIFICAISGTLVTILTQLSQELSLTPPHQESSLTPQLPGSLTSPLPLSPPLCESSLTSSLPESSLTSSLPESSLTLPLSVVSVTPPPRGSSLSLRLATPSLPHCTQRTSSFLGLLHLQSCGQGLAAVRHFSASSSWCHTDGSDGQKYWETLYRERMAEGENQDADSQMESTDCGEHQSPTLTHTDSSGRAVMVDVGEKAVTAREARARGRIWLGLEAFRLVLENKIQKGDVLTIAQLAGIMAAKWTSSLIPLCHNIALSKVDVKCTLNQAELSVDLESRVRTSGVTGVEMEALTAVSVAALTIYDMCKAVTRSMVISDVRLVMKTGGVRGDYWAEWGAETDVRRGTGQFGV